MTRDTAKHHAWSDWHSGLAYVPAVNQLYGHGFDDGWSAAIRAVAAAVSDGEAFNRLIEGGEA